MRTIVPGLKLSRMTAVAAAAMTLLMAGCGAGVLTNVVVPGATPAAKFGGSLHGGNQPIGNATVTLYAAGATGYGSASTQYAQTSTSTDGAASFSFNKAATNTGVTGATTNTYGCPATGDPQMYLIGSGGNTQGTGNGSNSAAVFLVTLGKCSTINDSTYVMVNEVTTVATMAALQQYFNPATESLGYPASTQGTLGFVNALTTIPTLANIATGVANGASTLTATPAGTTAAVSVTALPEQAKLNTMADILAACVNTTSNTSANCVSLFGAAYPPPNAAVTSQPSVTMAAATDTLQAAYYMFVNPISASSAGTANPSAMNALFNLAASSPPYMPVLAGVPTDWTLGIGYTSSSACTYGTFLASSYDLAADASGNIWIASGGTSTTSSNLIELLPNGTPATCALGASVALTKALTIDTGGNVWIASNAAGAPFYRYNIAGATSKTFATGTAIVPYAVAADGAGNIFYTETGNKTANEFVSGATAVSATSTPIGTVGTSPFFMAVDTSGTVIVEQSTVSTTLYDFYPGTGTGSLNGYKTASIGTTANVVNAYGVASGLAGKFFIGNSASSGNAAAQTADFFTQAAGVATYATNTAAYAGGIGSTRGPNVVDGAGNVWYANSLAPTGNYAAGSTYTSGFYSLAEFSSGLIALSPTGTTTVATMPAVGNTGGFQKDTTIITTAPRGLAIDPSGNVWGGSNAAGTGVFEIVGAAVPVVTPISASLAKSIAAGSTDAVSKP